MYDKLIRVSWITIASAVVLAVAVMAGRTTQAGPPLGSSITYQGQLELLGSPVTDTCDFEFSLWSDELSTDSGAKVGSTIGLAVDVVAGIFTVELNVSDEFGADAFVGATRWLQIGVCCTSPCGPLTTFDPRQKLTAAPASHYALGPWEQTTDGVSYLDANVGIGMTDPSERLSVAGMIESTSGGFKFPDGTTQTTAAAGGGSGWNLTGNAGTTPGTHFLGTTDNQPLEVHVNTERILRLEPLATGSNLFLLDGANVIAGFEGNDVEPGVVGATIAGGGAVESSGRSSLPNRVTGDFGVVAGGADNLAGSGDADPAGAMFATVGGGLRNTAGGSWASVGGGDFNTASADGATIGGGASNTASGIVSTVGGGFDNAASDDDSTIGGGQGNTASGIASTVGGGYDNAASGFRSTVAGGRSNTSSGFESTVGGGNSNTASGNWSTGPGGGFNAARGDYSFAAGRQAKADDDGAFVWADSQNRNFPSATESNFTPGINQFLARTTGGAVFVSAIDGPGNSTAGVELAAGGGSWSALSSRDAKANVDQVDGREILERLRDLPIATWNYKAQDESIRHIGPMAQDFSDAFGVGEKETMITTIDADGVALAAIQGLYEMVKEKDAEIAALRAQMENRIAALEKKLSELGAKVGE